MNSDNRLLGIGIAGTSFTAVCCVTTLPVAFLGAIGLSAMTGYLDYVLIPALVLFAGLTAYALYRRRQAGSCCAAEQQ
jgi:hypothetical protein